MDWLQEVGEYFPHRTRNFWPRQISQIIICERHKILYSPIGKYACTSLKNMMVDLSEVAHRDIIFKFGVHRVTDLFNTGMQLIDHEFDTVSKVMCSDEFYKFAVVREPISRTISAYTEKFLVNRNAPGNILHTIETIRSVRGQSKVDTHYGISFREFVNYLLSANAIDLDPHWGPQFYSLGGVDRYNDVFCMEHLDQLAARLSERTGQSIRLGKDNMSLVREATPSDTMPGRYVDKLPPELDALGSICTSDFMAPDLVARLQNYFSEDIDLYNAAREGLSDYQPQKIDLNMSNHAVSKQALLDPSAIARSVNVYSKGFFTLDETGHGSLQVLIVNPKLRTLDLDAVGPCYLAYSLRDSGGNVIYPTQLHPLTASKLDAGGQHWETVEITAPPEVHNATTNVVVSIQIGDAFHVEDLSPFHVTCAQLLRAQKDA